MENSDKTNPTNPPLNLDGAKNILKNKQPNTELNLDGALTILKKKEVSTSDVPEKKLDLEKGIGSSGGSKYRLPEQQSVPKDKLDTPDLYGAPQDNSNANYKTKTTYINPVTGKQSKGPVKDFLDINRKRKNELSSSFSQETKLTNEDIAEAENRLKTEEANGGFWGGVKQGLIESTNKAVEFLGLPRSVSSTLKIEERKPFSEEIKQVKIEAKKNKQQLSEAEVQQKAKELFVEKQKDNIFIDKANSFLDNLDETDKKILELDRYDQIDFLNDDNKKRLRSQAALKMQLESDAVSFEGLKKQIEDYRSKNIAIPEELINKANDLKNSITSTVSAIDNNYAKLSENDKDLSTAEKEFDLFKRENRDWVNIAKNIGISTGDLVVGLLDFYNYTQSFGGPLGKMISSQGSEITSELTKKLDAEKEKLRKPIESIESVEGFVNYATDLVATQLPILAATATGTGGLAVIGASSTGEKYAEMNEEVMKGEAKYSPLQMAMAPLLYGGAEVVSELPTLAILKKGQRVLKSAATSSSELLDRTIKDKAIDWAKDYGIDMSKEMAGEQFTNFTQNFTDKYVLGKKEVGLLDNTGKVFKDTFTLTSILKVSPHIAGAIVRPFQSKNTLKELDINSKRIIELTNQLELDNLSDIERNVLRKELDKVTAKSSEIMAATIDRIDTMPDELYDEVLRLTKEAGRIKAEASEIDLNSNLSNKKALLSSLETEFNEIISQRQSILEGRKSVVEVLPLKEQETLKRQAMEDLVTELNPDGSKDIEITDQQVLDRANEIYSQSKVNENTTTQTSTPSSTEVTTPSVQSNNNQISNEGTPTATTPTDGNISVGNDIMEKSGISEQQTASPEGLQSTNDGGNIEGKNEPKIDTSGIGTENYKQRKSQIEGRKREITIADGSKVKGQYKVVSSDDILASHNEENFSKTVGYPVNERGETINDRDYERDKNAQAEVSKIAQDYDGRAIQQTPVVTKEGIVVDGNNRVMSRKLAAKKGTDTKYKEALVNEADMYGINPDEISNVKNPIIVFEAENEMPYNTETLAKFNKQDKKEKSSSGKAVEFSKTLSDRAKRQIAEVYDQAERPSDVTSDVKAVKQLRDILLNNNIIQSNEIPRYFDVDKGVMTKEGVSLMENIALGSVFNEQTINTLSLQGMGDIRNKILQSLVGLINNASLEEKYRLGNEISKAIEVIYQLKTTKQSVEEYLDQPDLYGEKFIPNIDEYATILAISDAGFKKWLQNYNSNVGQPDIFKIEDGGITTKRDKTNETITDRKKQIPSNLRSDAEGNADENGQQNGNIEGKIENKPDNKNDVGRENNPEKPAEPEVKPISETSSADELLNWIEQAKKDLDQFGKENLSSVVIPVEIAKLALEAMRLAVIAGKKASEVIKAGIEVVKQSDWYQNLNSTEQKDVEDNFIASLSNNERQTQNKINRELSSSLSEKEAFDKFNETIDDGNKLLENKKTPKEILRKNYRAFIKKFTDRQYIAKRLLDKTGLTKTKNLIINSHGASGKAKRVFEEAYDTIYRKLTREDRATLDKIIQAKRFIAIDENREARGLEPVSHPNFIDKVVSQKYLDELKNQIGDEKFADLENRANEYFKTYKKLLKEVYDSGLINEASYEAMSDIDYQPRVFLQFVTDFNGDLADNSSKNLPDSGGLSQDQIKSMSEGDASALVSNSEWLLSNSISARTKAITNNNINKRFMTEEFPKAKKRFEAIDPKNFKSKEEERFYNYFKELDSKVVDNPIIGITDAGNPKYKIDKAPMNFSKMYYYIDGVQHQFFLEDELHQSWNDNLDGIFSGDTKEILSYASGSALVKGIATGNNPAFPIVNTPRDFLFTVTFSDQYSKIVPKAMVQVAKDVFKAIKAIKKDNEIVQKYFEYGGAMDFLSSQGKLKKETLIGKAIDKMISPKTKDISKSIFDKVTLHKISAYSELMFRLGIFQRSIQNQLTDLGLKDISEVTDSQQKDDIYNQAVASARGILDFNQGGAVTKDLEALIPYINVAFQGGRVALNALEKDPVGTTSRILQASTLASSIPIGISLMLIGLNKDDDDERSVHEIYIDAIDGISQYQKSKYMTIVTGKKNEDGQYQFIKIAKAQELTPVMMLTDNIYNNMIRSFADKPKRSASLIVSDVVKTFNSNLAPVPISSKAPLDTFTRIPIAKAYLTYFTGHDFFREQPLDFNLENKPSPSEGMNRKDVEYFYKKLGSEYGLSPIRSKAFVEALITSPDTNPFVGMLYGGAEAVSSDKDMKEIGLKLGKDIYKSTGKRIVGYTSDFNRNIETKLQLEEKIQEVKLKDAIQKKEFKDLAEQIIAKEIGEKEVNDKLKELDPEDRKRFINKVKETYRNKGVDRNLLDIKYERSSEIKALMILHHYGDIFDGSDDSRNKLNEMQRLKGIITPAVIREIQKLRKENNKPAN